MVVLNKILYKCYCEEEGFVGEECPCLTGSCEQIFNINDLSFYSFNRNFYKEEYSVHCDCCVYKQNVLIRLVETKYSTKEDIDKFLETKLDNYKGGDYKVFNQELLDNIYSPSKYFIYYKNELCGFISYDNDFLHYIEIYEPFRNIGICSYLIKSRLPYFKKVWINDTKIRKFWNKLGLKTTRGIFINNKFSTKKQRY